MRTRAQSADPTALDVPYIAGAFAVPEAEIQSLLDAPTTDLVHSFLATITNKSRDYDDLKAEKLRVDVELENSVRTSEAKAKAQKQQVSKHVKENEDLKAKLKEADAAHETLASELATLRAFTSGSTTETQALKQRIETLEGSNRDALALVESRSTEKDRLAIELSEQHSKLLSLRRDISSLEEKNQILENAASSQKFREQSLRQEIDLLKKNNEWQAGELQTRQQEHSKFRKERNARIATLQRELEDANGSIETLKRTETALRHRLEEMQAKTEEAFTRLAAFQEDRARKEQDLRTEIDSTKRLAELQAQNAATHKARLQDVHQQIDQIKEDAADEIGRLQAEVETERSDKETVERKFADLEIKIEHLEQSRVAATSRPGTPMRNGGGGGGAGVDPAMTGHIGSPIPGSARKVVGGLSFTQLYSKYTQAQSELDAEKRRTHKLSTALDEMIADIEGRQPEILELRNEHERLETEVLEFSRLLDESTVSREAAVKDAQRWHTEAAAAVKESDILRQQLRDLSAQIRILMVEIQSRDRGLGEMSAQERLELERAARGELDDAELDGMSATGRLISERLVIFRDITALQERNEELLRLTRALGEQMEGEEAREKAKQSAADHEEVELLRGQVDRYKDELKATATQIDSYIKERDMFRRMLRHRGQLAPDADLQSLFGQSMGPPATPMRNGQVMEPATPRSKDVEDLNKLLKEQQTFFDQYRTESSDDRKRLKDQVDSLTRDKNSLQAEFARTQSQLQLAGERYEMLQQNFVGLRSENQELQKRSRDVYEQLTRQESKTNQVAEDLVEAHSLSESLRNENANSKAEKELWKRIEARMTEDNNALMEERSRLNKLIVDMQNLQNERELTDSESRRRQNLRVEELGKELSETKRKADTAELEYKRLSQRREFEESERRKREDDLTKALGNVREELVAAKTIRDQLESRVEEMKIELRAAEEKVTALQPQPMLRTATSSQPDGGEVNDNLPPEQRLSIEVAELRRDLDLAKNASDQARQEVEQYKQIAQSTEEELASYNETSEQYKEETDRLVAEKDAIISELNEKIAELNNELSATNTELSELRSKQDDSSKLLEEQRAGFETELSRLQDDADRYSEEKKLMQEDLKAQADIAQQAQQSYEDELVKHGEAAKNLQIIRKEYHKLRAEIAGFRTEAEASKASLERGEESWAEQKDRYEREMEEMKKKRADLDEQNRLLHSQMDSFSSELKTLRQGRARSQGAEDEQEVPASETVSGSSGSDNYQEVVRYLRREKEILDVQHELAVQEGKRLQQQLDYSNNQLEEIHQKLVDERRQSTERLASEGSTGKLMEEIRQLNLYRESNEQLRNNLRQTEEKHIASRSEVETLLAEIAPLKARIGELEAEIEAKEDSMKLLEKDRDHWRERTQNIISKYDRVDPAELEDLRKKITDLQSERDQLLAEKEPLQQQVDEAKKQLESQTEEANNAESLFKERLDKFKEQAKQQNRKQNDRILEANATTEEAKAEAARVKEELNQIKAELEQVRVARDDALSQQKPEEQPREGSTEEGEVQGEENAETIARLTEAEHRATEQNKRADDLQAEVQRLEAKVTELEAKVTEFQTTPQLSAEATQPSTEQKKVHAQPEVSEESAQALQKLQQELADAQKEVEILRTNNTNAHQSNDQSEQSATPQDVQKSMADRVAEQIASIRVEMEQQHELARKTLEEQLQNRTNTMKDKLNQKLREDREKIRNELIAEHSDEIQRLRDEHTAAIEKLKADHAAEVERLMQTGAAAMQKAEAASDESAAEAMSPVKAESGGKSEVDLSQIDISAIDVTPAQAKEFVQRNTTIKTIVQNNITRRTEQLRAEIAQKDVEIKELQAAAKAGDAAATSAATSTAISQSAGEDGVVAEFRKQLLEDLQTERDQLKNDLAIAEKAKSSAENKVTQTEMKFKLLTNTRDRANAKLDVVKKAASETPEKPVKEVWEVAEKAQPPKPAPAPAIGGTAASTPIKSPAAVRPPTQGAPPHGLQSPSSGTAPTQQPAITGEPDTSKMQERAQRFGAVAPSPIAGPGLFGTPSVPSTTSTFGQPSQPQGASPSSPNPQAAVFIPSGPPGQAQSLPKTNQNPPQRSASQSGIPQPSSASGGSKLPTARGGGAQQGRGGGLNQGTRDKVQQSNVPRGGGFQVGRGGGGRGAGRGGANTGQKRQHDGSHDGDNKRSRGGGLGGA